MQIKTPITIAYGDGIGPEIMQATLKILSAAHAQIDIEVIDVGEKIFNQGYSAGITDEAWASLKRTRVFLKSPIMTPQGGGFKSLNVTMRKTLGLFANVRPCISYAPYVPTAFPNTNLVVVRENEEDTYSGIEYRSTEDVYECLKIVTRPGCERIVQYAFEYARKFNRKKVTCFSKDNIMKMTDGLFHRVFDEMAKDYPDIVHDHFIVDIGTALLATHPEQFDVIVTLNLYGDIISDVAAQITGSIGLAGSANIGKRAAMFEAVHGSAPLIAGKNIANPSGLLNAAVQMLIHINQPDVASTIENAWLTTLEDGIHTADIYSNAYSKQKVGTSEFADAIIERLGKRPQYFKAVAYKGVYPQIECYGHSKPVTTHKELVGIDVFIDNPSDQSAETLAEIIHQFKLNNLQLININSRGLKIWPNATIDDPYVRHCCCRFLALRSTRASTTSVENLKPIQHQEIIALLTQFVEHQLDVIKTENLYIFDEQIGFSLSQGE